MKVESKRFLAAVTAFVTVAFFTVFSGFNTYKKSDSKKPNEVVVTTLTKLGSIE